ncbi:MAG: hypothetical protein GY822_31910, partial [Deltaproteobacteria bacterium]|nr:hypothetical protein [Deltaproteobacteria bacterium]
MAEKKAKRLQESKANKAAMDELAALASPKAAQKCPVKLQNELDESPKLLKDKEESKEPAEKSPKPCLSKAVCQKLFVKSCLSKA